MNIKIRPIKTSLTGALLALSVACTHNKMPYVEMPRENMSPATIKNINDLTEKSKSITQDSRYVKYGEDTLEITNKSLKKTAAFQKKLNTIASAHVEQIVTSMYLKPVPYGKSIVMVPKYNYSPKYTNPIAIVKPPILTRDSLDMYVPVEYYGIPNPKLK